MEVRPNAPSNLQRDIFPAAFGTRDCPFVQPRVPGRAPRWAYRLSPNFVRLIGAMGALAMRQLDQMLELRAIGHAGANRRRPQSGTVTSMQAAILGLQRSAGNRAVASLLAVQRCGGAPCNCNHDERDATRLQRDESDAGDAPAPVAMACHTFTSFADDFLAGRQTPRLPR